MQGRRHVDRLPFEAERVQCPSQVARQCAVGDRIERLPDIASFSISSHCTEIIAQRLTSCRCPADKVSTSAEVVAHA